MAREMSQLEVFQLPKCTGSLSYSHGNVERVVTAGQYFDGPDGQRILLLTSGIETVIYMVVKPHPFAKDKLGKTYWSTAAEVRSDMQYAGAGTIKANLAATQATIQLWLDCFLGAVSLAGGPVAWAVTGVAVMDAVSKHYHNVPAYQELIASLAEVRHVLEPNCRVLWSKVIEKLLWEMTKEMPSMGAGVIWDFVKGKAISKGVIGRAIGYGLSVKRSGWHWRKKVWLVREMLTEVCKKVVVHMKKEGLKELKEEQVKALGVWVIKYLGTELTTLSKEESEQIVKEVAKNAGAIEPAIDRLIKAMTAVWALPEG
jgi:uncharacterized protein YaaW (UPF0174 family)